MGNYSDDVLGVTYGSLDHAAENIRKQSAQLQQTLDEIAKLVKTASGQWHGEAREAYAAQQNDWDKRALTIKNQLEQIATAVADAGPTYKAGDRRAAGHFQ